MAICYRKVLVEEMKPAPQAKCIVGIIARSEIISRTDLPIKIDEISKKIP
jgi:hypothetical protein